MHLLYIRLHLNDSEQPDFLTMKTATLGYTWVILTPTETIPPQHDRFLPVFNSPRVELSAVKNVQDGETLMRAIRRFYDGPPPFSMEPASVDLDAHGMELSHWREASVEELVAAKEKFDRLKAIG